MARFQLQAAMTVGHTKLRAGRTICDGTGCSANDFVWTGLNASTLTPGMVALDGPAATMKSLSKFPQAPGPASGVDSID
jgi:hypothetical protein